MQTTSDIWAGGPGLFTLSQEVADLVCKTEEAEQQIFAGCCKDFEFKLWIFECCEFLNWTK